MNVGELIKELEKHDPALPVLVQGYEGGATERFYLAQTQARPCVGKELKDYYGEFAIKQEEPPIFSQQKTEPIDVLFIGRKVIRRFTK